MRNKGGVTDNREIIVLKSEIPKRIKSRLLISSHFIDYPFTTIIHLQKHMLSKEIILSLR